MEYVNGLTAAVMCDLGLVPEPPHVLAYPYNRKIYSRNFVATIKKNNIM